MSNKGKQQPQQQKAVSQTSSKLTYETLISSLLDQGFEVLDKKDIPNQEKKMKAVAALHTLLKAKLKAPRDYKDYPKDAISFNLQLQMNSGLTALNSRRVLSLIFTFLIEELMNWEEYGVSKDDVHPDVCLNSRLYERDE